jgi:O-antigen/teichoic acid export membrane protein
MLSASTTNKLKTLSSGPLATSFVASGLIQCINVATGVILARELGPSSRGELAAIILWPSILAAVGSIGVSDAATYVAARKEGSIGELFGTLIVIAAVQSILLVGIGASIYPFILGRHHEMNLGAAYLFLLFIPIYLVYAYVVCLLNGLQVFLRFNILRVLPIVGPALGLGVLALRGELTIESGVIAYLIGNSVALLAAVLTFICSFRPLHIRPERTLSREMLSYGIRSHTTAIASLLNQRLDQLLISVFLAPARLGLYVTAVTFTSPTNLIGSSVSLVALPVLARMEPGKQRTAAASRYVAYALGASIIVTIPILLFTSQLIGFFFGSAFVAASSACRILLLAGIVLTLNRVFGSVLKAVGRPLDAGIAESAGVVATMGSLAILLPRFGLIGAAAASLLAYGVVSAWMFVRVTRVLGISPREAFRFRGASAAKGAAG